MKIQRYGIKRIKRGKNTVFIPKIVPDGYCSKFIHEEDILPLLNPWHDVKGCLPSTPRKVFVEYDDGISICYKESWYCEQTQSFCGVENVLRWMEIPKNEVEE